MRVFLMRLPKAELHLHLDGSLRPGTMLELAAANGVRMPRSDPESLREYMHVREADDLVGYLERFDVTLSLLQSGEALERVAYELAEDLAAEHVRYAEIRYSPILSTRRGLSLEETVAAPLRGLRRAAAEFGIRTGLIVCAIRTLAPRISSELARLAVSYRNEGVVAFDLAGAEAGYPASAHREAFDIAHEGNLPVTIHAGEAAGPESIAAAVHLCGARRIGHGTRLGEDPALMEYLIDFGIPLEVCLTSNVQTRAVPSFEEHPLRAYYDAGAVVTLNTDNRLMSATTLSEEYWRAHRFLNFTPEELARIALMAFGAAFLHRAEKELLLAQARAEIEAMLPDVELRAEGPGRG